MHKTWFIALLIVVIGAMAQLGACAADKSGTVKGLEKEDAARNVLMALEAAITSKNADEAASLFAEDTQFIDQAGETVHGRKAIRERFAQLFKVGAALGIGIHPQNISFLADNVALVTGEVSHKIDQLNAPASIFSTVMVKSANQWLIKELTETAIQAAQPESHLQELGWLIGKWSVENANASVQMNVEWAPGRKFITSKTMLSRNGKEPQIDTQVIGWDPRNNLIVSWHFDSNGGFGNGTWTKTADGNRWVVEVVGVGADGSSTTASNVFCPKSGEEFTWQSVHRSLDGKPVPDTESLTVHKGKQ